MLRKRRKDILSVISSTNRFDPVILNVNIIVIIQSFLNVTTLINYLKCSPSKEKYGDTQALYTLILEIYKFLVGVHALGVVAEV